MSDYNQRALKLIEQIYTHDYYVTRLTAAIAGRDLKRISNMELSGVLFDFWDSLPDSPAIHRHPFDELCDLLDMDN